MEHLPALGTAIRDTVRPTLAVYEPLLQNADTIRSAPWKEYSYGPQDRQRMDVYTPPSGSGAKTSCKPALIFLYGGGLERGDKILPGYAGELCYANIASFFALNFGYTIIIPDYRLVGKHEAKFSSGGEDVALAFQWGVDSREILGPEPIDLVIMGNSAGGVHLSTFLLHPSFADTRAKVLAGDGTRLRGVVLLSVPFHFEYAHESRAEINQTYFGNHIAHSPLGLLKSAPKRVPRFYAVWCTRARFER